MRRERKGEETGKGIWKGGIREGEEGREIRREEKRKAGERTRRGEWQRRRREGKGERGKEREEVNERTEAE